MLYEVITHAGKKLVQALLCVLKPRLEFAELAVDPAGLGHQYGGVLAARFRLADLLGVGIACALQFLRPRLNRLALGLQGEKSLAVERRAARREARGNLVELSSSYNFV